MVYTGKSRFRVCPDKWDEIEDSDIVRMYQAFRDWIAENEEHMTIPEAEEVWEMCRKWEDYLEKRGLESRERRE